MAGKGGGRAALVGAKQHLGNEAGDNGAGPGVEGTENQAGTVAKPGDKAGETGSGGLGADGSTPEDPNAGKREAAIEAETTRIERQGDNAELDLGNLGGTLVSTILDIYRHRRFAWHELSAIEQRDVQTAIDYAVKATVRESVRLLAAQGRDSIRAKLEKYADSGGKITLNLTIAAADDQTVLSLHRSSGKEVMIVSADADSYLLNGAQEQEEEPALGFEAGSDQDHPDDDSDLAGGIPTRVNITTGLIEQREDGDGDWIETDRATLKQLAEADPGAVYRTNRETGMVQRLPTGADQDDETAWEDIREATPEEIEAESPVILGK